MMQSLITLNHLVGDGALLYSMLSVVYDVSAFIIFTLSVVNTEYRVTNDIFIAPFKLIKTFE